MLTPQEVAQHAFAKASFGGYNMAMVDEFLDALTEDYTTLYKENQVLKGKMKILVDKVEEYRATEDGMRKAFLAAQKSAEDIVAQAEAQRESLVKSAEGELRARLAEIRAELDNEQHRLAAAQASTAAYVAKLKELCRHELEYIEALPELAVPPPSRMDTTAREIEDSLQRTIEEETPAQEETVDLEKDLQALRFHPRDEEDGEDEPVREAEEDFADEDDDSTRRFDNLQFGRDYEIR